MADIRINSALLCTTCSRQVCLSTVGAGGVLYIYCTGDGIDSNSRTSYSGIVFSGGNSAIDTEQGYKYTGGSVIAIMPQRAMTSEAKHCQNFASIGKSTSLSLSAGAYLVARIGETTATVKLPVSISAVIVVLGDNAPAVSTESATAQTLDENGVAWQ